MNFPIPSYFHLGVNFLLNKYGLFYDNLVPTRTVQSFRQYQVVSGPTVRRLCGTVISKTNQTNTYEDCCTPLTVLIANL